MKIDRVLFIDHEVLKLDKKKFIELHKQNTFTDISMIEREKKLADIYDKILDSNKPQMKNVIDTDFKL